MASEEPPVTASAMPSGPAAVTPPPGADCLSPQEIEANLGLWWKMQNKQLSVVGVGPDGHVHVYQAPSFDAPVAGRLSYDARDLVATGRACREDDSIFVSLRAGPVAGWVNAASLLPTTMPAEETARFQKYLKGETFTSPEGLADAVARGLAAEHPAEGEVPFQVEVLGVARSDVAGKRTARVALEPCCYADDSVRGEQVDLDLDELGGTWRLVSARVRRLCPRGAQVARCL